LAAGTNGYVMTLAAGVPTWAAAASSGITISDDTTTNATRYLTFTSATSGSITSENVSSTKLQYNPSTGTLTTSAISTAGLTNSGNESITGTLSVTGQITGTVGINVPNTFGYKNRLINGGFFVDQRNYGASQSLGLSAVYTVDRWYALSVGVAATGQRIAGSNGFQYSYQITGVASNTGITFGQKIESVNCYDLASSTVTLSAYIKASALTSVTWTAYYPTATDNYTSRTQISTGTFTINTTSTQYSTNISLPSSVTNGLQIEFTTGALTSGTITYTGVQLEKGLTATSFDYRPYGTELQLCQRYYQYKQNLMGSSCGTTNRFIVVVPLIVTMRTNPTLGLSSALGITSYAVASYTQSSASVGYEGSTYGDSIYISFPNFSGLSAQYNYACYPGTSQLQLFAEL